MVIPSIIIDCAMTREVALRDNPLFQCPSDIRVTQELLTLQYWSPNGGVHQGQLVVDSELSSEVRVIFKKLLETRFPIAKMIPIVQYGWSDDRSMKDNNTSGFNYRTIAGITKLSQHAYGRAIDFNPLWNPYIRGDVVAPQGATYNPRQSGTILHDSFIVRLFKEFGWLWGGDCWSDRKDYQHFEKPVLARG